MGNSPYMAAMLEMLKNYHHRALTIRKLKKPGRGWSNDEKYQGIF
jgi:hypothetical protein